MNIRTSCLVRIIGELELGRVCGIWTEPHGRDHQPVDWIRVEMPDGRVQECEACDVTECIEPKDTSLQGKVPKLHEQVVTYLDQIDEGES